MQKAVAFALIKVHQKSHLHVCVESYFDSREFCENVKVVEM